MSAFNEKLRTLLANREWTQARFASMMNVTPSAVQKWVVGKNMPDAETVKKISDLMYISTDNLLDEGFEVREYFAFDRYLPYSVACRFPEELCDTDHTLIEAYLEKGAVLHRFKNGAGEACSAIYYAGQEIWWHYREHEARMIRDWNTGCPV